MEGIKRDTAATSHSAHYLIASSPAPGSRSVEEEEEEGGGREERQTAASGVRLCVQATKRQKRCISMQRSVSQTSVPASCQFSPRHMSHNAMLFVLNTKSETNQKTQSHSPIVSPYILYSAHSPPSFS